MGYSDLYTIYNIKYILYNENIFALLLFNKPVHFTICRDKFAINN